VELRERVDEPEERSGCVARLSREPVLAIDAPWTRPIEMAGKFPSRRVVIAVQHWFIQLKLEVYANSAVVIALTCERCCDNLSKIFKQSSSPPANASPVTRSLLTLTALRQLERVDLTDV
jgi:hypothetical protein